MKTLYTMRVEREQDVVSARQKARKVALALAFDEQDQTRIATAVSELARNALAYARGAQVEFSLLETPSALRIRVSDRGTGIPAEWQREAGSGLNAARRLMDSFSVDSSPQGTVVDIGKLRPESLVPPTDASLRNLTASLQGGSEINSLLEEAQRQNRELLVTLARLESSQQELLRLNQELEDTNRGVVALYTELDEKAKELHRANELKSRFLAYMSHEFRTPLHSILALSRILLDRVDGDLSGEQERQTTLIRGAAAELLGMVNDLLDLAKVESGTISVHKGQLDVAELFSTLRGMFLPLFSPSGVALTFSDASSLPHLLSDEARVGQILRNFISNALKFTPTGEVAVSAQRQGDKIHFSVRDSGIGIHSSDQERIFQEFGQVDSPTARAQGTGLGLAISRKMAELLGGRITLESHPGKGSRFTLVLPYKIYEEGLELPTGETLEPPATPEGHILIIDNDATDRYILKEHLGGVTLPLSEAPDGTTGLSKAAGDGVRLIFLDLVMPSMNGFEVLRKLKSNPATRAVPVVVITSKVLSDAERQEIAAAAAVLPKSMFSQGGAAESLRRLVAQLVSPQVVNPQAVNPQGALS